MHLRLKFAMFGAIVVYNLLKDFNKTHPYPFVAIIDVNDIKRLAIWLKQQLLRSFWNGNQTASFINYTKVPDRTIVLWDVERIFKLDELIYGCDRVRNYLRTNAEVKAEGSTKLFHT